MKNKKKFPLDVYDIAGIAGIIMVQRGLYLVYPPLFWIFSGAACIVVSAAAARVKKPATGK